MRLGLGLRHRLRLGNFGLGGNAGGLHGAFVDVEVGRRTEAVGFDVVASIHAGVGVVDATRGIKMVDAA